MKVILFSPTGSNPNVRAAADGLLKANLLAEFHMPIAVFPGSVLERISSISAFSELRRRCFSPLLKPYIKTFPWLEIGRHVAAKAGLTKLIEHETGIFNIDSVSKNLDRRIASRLKFASIKGVKAVYSCEDVTAFSFSEAKFLGLKCLYDLPMGYWRTAHRLLEIERERWPEWANTITGFKDSKAKLARKDEELSLADCIFTASSFSASTLKDYPGPLAPVKVIAYGFPPVNNEKKGFHAFRGKHPLKLLFVGSLSQRKGIANLFAAVDGLQNHVELTLVGHKASDNCPALDAALAKHIWFPTLAHDKVLQLMHESDVLVFPSLFEGFGLVITEAMSQGTPVITTERTGGADLITHGKDGWLVESGSTERLKEVIEDILHQPGIIEEVGQEALKKAALRPWKAYGHQIAETIKCVLEQPA